MMKLPLNVDFTGKVVVVTGAGGVLCGEMARAYAQAGAKVAALDLNEEAVKKLADELTAEGFICKGYKANVLDAEALEAVHQQVLADLGPCDILINGAGGNNPRATTDNEYQHEAKEGQKTFFDLEHGHPRERDCSRLPRQQPEPRAALQRGWHAHRAQCENPERHAHGPLCRQQGTPWRRVLPHR